MLLKQHGFDPKKGFTKVPNVVLFDGKLTPTDVRTYAALAAFCWFDKNECYPSLRALAELTGVHVTTVRSSLRRLQEFGLISIEQAVGRGQTNTYRLHLLAKDNGEKGSADATFSEKKVVSTLQKGSVGATRIIRIKQANAEADELRCAVLEQSDDVVSSLEGSPLGLPSEADERGGSPSGLPSEAEHGRERCTYKATLTSDRAILMRDGRILKWRERQPADTADNILERLLTEMGRSL